MQGWYDKLQLYLIIPSTPHKECACNKATVALMKSIIKKKSLPNRRGNLIIFYRAINILHLVLSRIRASLVYVVRSTEWMVFRSQHSLPSRLGDRCSDLSLLVASPALSVCSYPRIRSTIWYKTTRSVASWGFSDSEPVSPCPCVQIQCIDVSLTINNQVNVWTGFGSPWCGKAQLLLRHLEGINTWASAVLHKSGFFFKYLHLVSVCLFSVSVFFFFF